MAMSRRFADLQWRFVPTIVNHEQIMFDFIERIMPIVRPAWNRDEVRTKEINTGLGVTNELIGFCSTNEDIVLLRINGKGTERFIDRDREIHLRCLLDQAKIGPPLYCEFKNGLCYGFVPGQLLKRGMLKDPGLLRQIAKSVALFHSYELPLQFCGKEKTPLVMFDSLYSMVLDDSRQQSRRFAEVFVSKEKLGKEISDMKRIMKNFVSPVVLCHNDLQSGNIIVNDHGEISFIDFEYAGLNHSACDIGNFFCEYAGLELDYEMYPNETEQKMFIRLYLEEASLFNGKVPFIY